MNLLRQNYSAFNSELIKIKSTPVWYMLMAACLFIATIGFAAHYLDIHNAVDIGRNPWERLLSGATSIYSIFILCPLTILLISAVVFTEQKAQAWKYLYTTPNRRGIFYFNKLFLILGLISITTVLLFVSMVLTGFVLDFKFPEYEFSYYSIPFADWFGKIYHSLLALLGIIGLQYFLCMNFKHFMVPLGVGLLGFVTGFILLTTNQKAGLYNPYDFPMIVKDFNMVAYGHREEVFNGLINNVELHSLICFLFFILLGYILENRKNIHS